MGKPPDLAIIEASPRRDWYFLWYYALLTLIPRWSENYVIILGPLVLGVALILLPLVAGRGERSPPGPLAAGSGWSNEWTCR